MITHAKSDTIADFTGTVTVYDQLGSTQTVAATDLVRPSDWNSQHYINYALSGNTAGSSVVSGLDITLVGGNNVTLSADTAGSKLVFSAAAGGAGDGGNFIAAGTRTAGSISTVLFSNSNGVTFGLDSPNGSVLTMDFGSSSLAGTGFSSATTAGTAIVGTLNTAGLSLGVPAYLTTARASTDAVGLATALTAGPLAWTVNSAGISLNAGSAAGTTSGFSGNLISGSMTHNTAGLALSLNHPAWLTTAAASDHSHGNPTLNLTNLSGTTASNSAGFTLSLSAAAPSNTITMYATSNTTQSSTGTANVNSLIFAGAGAASVGITNGSIVISAPNAGAGNITISAGTTNGGLANVSFADSNNMSFGLNGSTITASFNAINLGVSTGGNTAGTTGTIEGNGGQYLLVGGDNITLSQSTNGASSGTLSIVGPASSSLVGSTGISLSTNGSTITIYNIPRSSWVAPQMQLSVLGAMGNGSYSIAYRDVLWPVTATRVDAPFHWVQATTANANTIGIAMTVLCGIYTRNASTLNTVSSASTQTTYTYASNSAGNTQLSVAAYRPISIPMNVNMTPGQYYFGFGISTAATSIGTATTTAAQTISIVGCPQGSSAVPWTDDFTRVTATSVGMFSGHGIYSAAVSSVVPAISLSAINQSGSYFHRANNALVFRG